MRFPTIIVKLVFFLHVTIFIFLFSSCKNGLGDSIDIKTIDIWVESAEKIKMSDIFSNPEIIALETTPQTKVGRIRKIEITKNLIVTLNDSPDYTINVFNRKGEHLSTFNRFGNGPCEYNSPQFVIVNDSDSTIELLSPITNELIKYSLYGDCLENIVFPVFGMDAIKVSESEYLVYLSGIVTLEKNKLLSDNIQLVNKNSGIIDSYLPFNPESGPAFLTISWDNFNRFNNNIYISISCYDTIYSYNSEKKLVIPEYYLNFNGHNIPSEIIKQPYRTIGQFKKRVIDGNYVYGINSVRFSSNSIFFSFQFGDKAKKHICLYDINEDISLIANRVCNDFIGEFYYHDIRNEDIPVAAYHDELFFCYEPNTLISISKIAKERMTKSDYAKWYSIYDSLINKYSNLDITSNPIILKVNL
ncbi:MAG: 6-bladed beta-propeller [bacterium]